ncbi:uncharacterized protein CTRU02_211894 [Colletotrichum truncatum]|uniref:Uncharacterized protein n=1 Tax=Colletotrichum truncatum TaxID=5467 RepID=A0ACC3YMH6_COLTU|nr:uncharacterized protein CTRU02_07303 [Colletotrichum truncatum]KAF6791541.1 hypothetical protein CTRU02_07303 [Colletotrichum truncatum]
MATLPLEAWIPEDDWRQTQSAAERRKLQNRLNQRVHRKRKHLQRCAANGSNSDNREVGIGPAEPPKSLLKNDRSLIRRLDHPQLPANLHNLPILVKLRKHPLYGRIAYFLFQAYVDWSLGHPQPCTLPGLTRLNAMDALLRNAFVLQIPVEYLESDDYDSLFNSSDPSCPSLPQAMPSDLSPTALQKAVTHHSWLDVFPFPRLRDNILQGISSGELDEEQMSVELCCDLLDLEATSTSGLMIWGEAWEASSWEFSPEFFKRWGPLLKGCSQMLEATNYWREKRGEMRIGFVLN